MKNGLLIWNVILTLAAGYLLFNQFSSKKSKGTTVNMAGGDSTGNSAGFKIAYFEMDSVEANFNMVKEVKKEISQKDAEYSNNLRQIDQAYKDKYNEFASQETMTPEQNEAAQNVLRQLADKLKDQKQGIDQQYQDFVMRKNLEIKKEIEKYLQTYNEVKKYSYIIAYEPGLFYYRDSAYNITADVIKGLNSTYKPAVKK